MMRFCGLLVLVAAAGGMAVGQGVELWVSTTGDDGWPGTRKRPFATLEKGIVLKVEDEAALERILKVPEMEKRLIRRLGESEALLKDQPLDRRLKASFRSQGIHIQGP